MTFVDAIFLNKDAEGLSVLVKFVLDRSTDHKPNLGQNPSAHSYIEFRIYPIITNGPKYITLKWNSLFHY